MLLEDILGSLGSGLLAICSFPLLIETIKTKSVQLNWAFLSFWYVGEICTLLYILITVGYDFYLLANYGTNTAILTYIVSVKYNSEKKMKKVLDK